MERALIKEFKIKIINTYQALVYVRFRLQHQQPTSRHTQKTTINILL